MQKNRQDYLAWMEKNRTKVWATVATCITFVRHSTSSFVTRSSSGLVILVLMVDQGEELTILSHLKDHRSYYKDIFTVQRQQVHRSEARMRSPTCSESRCWADETRFNTALQTFASRWQFLSKSSQKSETLWKGKIYEPKSPPAWKRDKQKSWRYIHGIQYVYSTYIVCIQLYG